MARCTKTNLSCSTAYRRGCKCDECRAHKRLKRESPEVNAKRSREWRAKHPELSRALAKACAKRNPTRILAQGLKKYGLSLEKYSEMLKDCGGLCMICGGTPSGMSNSRSRLHVDHDHVTGKVRGLLCGSCNVGLGHFNHDPIRLLDARIYLQESIDKAE